MARLTLSVLGELQVLIDDRPISSFESDKVCALLAYLAVKADHANRRETLVGLLWPECPEGAARHNLSQALFNLRLALGDHTARPPYLLITRDAIQFNRESDYSLDLDQFNAYYSAWEKDQGRESVDPLYHFPRLEEMVQLYRGEFLQHFYLEDSAEYEEWILVQRESLHQRVMNALTNLANEYELRRDFQAARRFAMRQLELDPWREEAHCQVMRLLAFDGQRSAALAQYENCRKVLAEELGAEPSSQTRDLYEQIRSGTFKPKADSPAPVSSTPIHNLPIPLTPFIGREQELADLNRLIADPQCRCITLLGPGGTGKTRLALQAADQHADEFTQGTAFIPLVSVGSIEAVIPAIASGIGFAFYGPTDPKVQLLNYLRDKQMLLIVDNVEHLLAEGPQPGTIADLLIEILQAAGLVRLLVTSREAMNLQGEWIFEVQGLAFPGVEQADRLDEYSAVALFVQRARRARSGFEMNAEDKTGVVRLCRLVEGLPLAIELAAAWVRLLSPMEIAKEIETSLDFLNAQVRDLPERHRSMRAVFDHSWQRLSTEEQQVLCKLSVFRGGFQRQAAEQVAGASLPVLSSLVIRSLLRRTATGRYDLHELVRQYAEARLEAELQVCAETHQRHCEVYLNWLHANESALRGPAQSRLMQEIRQEYGNLRLAWGWAVEHGRVPLIVLALRCFWSFCEIAGWFQEANDQIERAIQAMRTSGDTAEAGLDIPAEIGPLWACQAWFCFRLGLYGQARQLSEQSVRLLRSAADRTMLAEALVYSAVVIYRMGETLEARRLVNESLELAQAEGDGWTAAWALCLQGIIANVLGQYSEAHQQLSAGLAGYRAIGDPHLTAFALNYLSPVAMTLGRHDEAHALAQESLELSTQLADWWGIGLAYCNLGAAAQARQDWADAESQLQRGIDTFREVGAYGHMAQYLARLGEISMAIGDWAKARRVLLEAIRIDREVQALPALAEAAAILASLQKQEGAGEQALELALHVLGHAASAQSTKDRAERLRTELEACLSLRQIEMTRTRVCDRSFDALIEEILG